MCAVTYNTYGFIGTISNIEKEKKVNRRLSAARRASERAYISRDSFSFVSFVSILQKNHHHRRSPLCDRCRRHQHGVIMRFINKPKINVYIAQSVHRHTCNQCTCTCVWVRFSFVIDKIWRTHYLWTPIIVWKVEERASERAGDATSENRQCACAKVRKMLFLEGTKKRRRRNKSALSV